jgi:hypothetical protein
LFGNTSAIPFSLRRRAQIDAAYQKRELFARQLHTAVIGAGPVQPSLLHAPSANPQTQVIEKENFHPISSFVSEQKEMPATLHPSRFCLSFRLFIRFFMAIFFP